MKHDSSHDVGLLRSRRSETGKCLLTWSTDGSISKELVTDLDLPADIRWRFDYEARINRMLVATPPSVRFAPLIGTERDGEVMRFEAVDGEPLGPKFPIEIDLVAVEELCNLAQRLQAYRPVEPWIRRYRPVSELRARRDGEVVSSREHAAIEAAISGGQLEYSFAHGDLTPRNVIDAPSGFVLIDWEFAGWYPAEYDRAFLWMVLVDLPAGRQVVEHSVPASRRLSFWLCAYLIQALHLEMWARRQQVPKQLALHVETKDRAYREIVQLAR